MTDLLLTLANFGWTLAMLVGFVYLIRWVRRKGGRLERVGRWSTLEQHFRVEAIPNLYTYTSGLIGLATYANTLKLAYADTGIFLDVPSLFRFGNKPLFIPYSELVVSEKNPTLWYQFRTYTQFIVRGQSVCIDQDDAQKILARQQAQPANRPTDH